jgi:hypothetical protein
MTALDEGTGIAARQVSTAPAEPLWYLRINTLRRIRLSDPALRELLASLADAELAVHAAASRCSDELYELIGSAPGKDARRRLVELRRTIHNDRSPKTQDAPAPSVARWLAARDQRQRCRDEIARCYPDAAGRERVTLAAMLGDENLRCALTLAAPEVYAEAERYRAAVTEGQPVPAHARKAERGLIQYTTRAMVRTSPLSRFTAVSIAVPDPDGVTPDRVRFSGAVSFPSLDRVMLGYVVGGLHASRAGVSAELWVGLPPTSALADGKLIFLRRTDTGFQRLAASVTGAVRLLVNAVSMGPRHVRAIAREMAGELGCSAQDATEVVLKAVRQGLLCTYHEPEDCGADLDHMLDQPDTTGARLLSDVRARLPRLAAAPAAERGRELAAIAGALSAASRLAGRPAQVMVEEDYVIPPTRVATGPWRERLGDLAAGVELLSVFDWLHDVRAVMTDAFTSRFGSGANVPLAEHAEHLIGEVKRRAAVMDRIYRAGEDTAALADIGPADGCLERLYALRWTVIKTVSAGLAMAAAAGEPEWALSPADAVELVEALPARFRRDPMSYGVLVQQAGGRLVFNDGLPGHGMLYARFLDADRRLGGSAMPYLAKRVAAQYGGDGSRVAEDLGLHGLNVNAHPPILPDGLRPDDWYSLRLAHDKETDTLHVEDSSGRRLRVLPLGTGHPLLLPPPASIASGLVISGRLYNVLPSLWHESVPWDGQATRTCPRMSVGDVVLARRRWYGGAEFTEAVAAGPAEHERMIALTAWRHRHGVPEEVVIKTTPADEGPQSVGVPEAQGRRLRQKPQYVDLTSALSVRVLPRMLERRTDDGDVEHLEEALPSVTDGTYATEWVVEIDRRPGGLFRYGGELS